MANTLIDVSSLARQAAASGEPSKEGDMSEKTEGSAPERCFLFSPEAPGGRLFVGAEAIAAAESEGWVDSPAELKSEAESSGGAKAKKKAKKKVTRRASKSTD